MDKEASQEAPVDTGDVSDASEQPPQEEVAQPAAAEVSRDLSELTTAASDERHDERLREEIQLRKQKVCTPSSRLHQLSCQVARLCQVAQHVRRSRCCLLDTSHIVVAVCFPTWQWRSAVGSWRCITGAALTSNAHLSAR